MPPTRPSPQSGPLEAPMAHAQPPMATSAGGRTAQWMGVRRGLLIAVGATLSAVSSAPTLIVAVYGRADSAMVVLVVGLCVTAVAAAAAAMYRARQETRRKEIEWHGPNVLADAMAAAIGGGQHSRRHPRGDQSEAESDQITASAHAFLAENGASILNILGNPAQAGMQPVREDERRDDRGGGGQSRENKKT